MSRSLFNRTADTLASRYEVTVEQDPDIGPWIATVWLVSKTSRQDIAIFSGRLSAEDARDDAYSFLKDRPR